MNKYITRLFPYITIYMHDIYILLHLFLINVTKNKAGIYFFIVGDNGNKTNWNDWRLVMKELTKKVVILNNFSSPYVSQAIIILKDYNPKLESRAIADAETIVSRYIERIQKTDSQQRLSARNLKY